MSETIVQLDYPYIIFYFIQIGLAYLFWKKRDERIPLVSLAITFFFFAFRAPIVGADTWEYVTYLTGERDFYNNDERELETGFLLYRKLVSGFSPSRLVVMLINSLIGFGPMLYMMKKYSNNVALTIVMFCFMGCLNVYFVGLRQMLGLAPMLVVLMYSLNEKRRLVVKLSLLVLTTIIGYYFHTVCFFYGIIFALAILIPGGNRKAYLWTIVVTALWGIVAQKFDIMGAFNFYMSFHPDVTERINIYFTDTSFDMSASLNILLRPTFVAFFVFYFIDKEKLSHPFCKIYLSGVVMFNLLSCVPMVHRMIPPQIMFGSIVFTWVFGRVYREDIKIKSLVNVLSVIIVLYFARAAYIDCSEYSLNDYTRMHPYQFIFEDYSPPSTIYIMGR